MVDNVDDLKTVLNEENYGFSYEKNEDNSFTFKKSKFYDFFSQLEQLFNNFKFYDIILKTTDEPSLYIHAHKIILCSSSGYFRALLCGGFKENELINEILIQNISHSILKQIINYIYTGKLDINVSNVSNLLPAAQILQIDDIVNACCIFLDHNLDSSNCIGIEEFADRYGCVDLMNKARRYMMNHCYEVIKSEEFLNLDSTKLVRLLEEDNLNIRCESLIFNAVCGWTRYDLNVRRFQISNVLKVVRMHLLSPKFLQEQINNNELLKLPNVDTCRHQMSSMCEKLKKHQPIMGSSSGRNPTCAIYIVGGYLRESLNITEALRVENGEPAKTWSPCAPLKVARSGLACVAYAFYVFAIGGRFNNSQGSVDCNSVERFDPFHNEWYDCSPMSVPRSRAAADVIDGLIYVVGGANNSICNSSVERYYAQEDRWEAVCSMNEPRVGLSCRVVNRLLYAIGGFNGIERLNSVEVFCPDDNNWAIGVPMNIPRSGAAACSHENDIYVIGGYDGTSVLSSVEKFNTLTKKWEFIEPLSSPRSALVAIAKHNKIIVCGGYDGNNFVAVTEIYDFSTKTWTSHTNITSERSGHGIALTVQIPSSNKE